MALKDISDLGNLLREDDQVREELQRRILILQSAVAQQEGWVSAATL